MDTQFYETPPFDISRERKYHSSMPTHHYHNGYEIFYLVSGDICYFVNDVAYQVVGGALLMIDVNEVHKLVNSSGETFERITLVFQKEFLDDLFPADKSFNVLSGFVEGHRLLRLSGSDQAFVEKLFDKMVAEFAKRPPGYEFYLKTLLFELLLFIYRSVQAASQSVQETGGVIHRKIFEIVDYLNRHYDQPHTIADISRRFFISPSYFCKSFKDSTGFTFTEYLNNVRIKEARSLLVDTELKVAHIAERVGFDSLTHFGRVFKEITSLSPLKYRRIYRTSPA